MRLAVVLQILGVAALSVAGFCVSAALGWLVVGAALVLFGLVAEMEVKRGTRKPSSG